MVSYSPSGQVGGLPPICYDVRTKGRATGQGQVLVVGRGLGGSCPQMGMGEVIHLGRALTSVV